jgi:hypothetical protein
VQGIAKFVKILLIQVNFGFDEVAIVKFAAFAFGNGDVIVIVPGGFYIKKIGAFSCSDTL